MQESMATQTCNINLENLKIFLMYTADSVKNFLKKYNAIIFDSIEFKHVFYFLNLLSSHQQIIFKKYKQIPSDLLLGIPKSTKEIIFINCTNEVYQSTLFFFQKANIDITITEKFEAEPRVETKTTVSNWPSSSREILKTNSCDSLSFVKFPLSTTSETEKNFSTRIIPKEKTRATAPKKYTANFDHLLGLLRTPNLQGAVLHKATLTHLVSILGTLSKEDLNKFFSTIFQENHLVDFNIIKKNVEVKNAFQYLEYIDQINHLLFAIEKDLTSQITWMLDNIEFKLPDFKLLNIANIFVKRMKIPDVTRCTHLVKFMKVVNNDEIIDFIWEQLLNDNLVTRYLITQLTENKIPLNKNIPITPASTGMAIKNLLNENQDLEPENTAKVARFSS